MIFVMGISIHVPTRGTTDVTTSLRHYILISIHVPTASISIHVPTRGTTGFPLPSHPRLTNFNPRAHEGHDTKNYVSSTLTLDFNPRAHEGHDTHSQRSSDPPLISIHVPTRGTTRCRGGSDNVADFNPRAHEGHDWTRLHRCQRTDYFNPRAHEGHDAAVSPSGSPAIDFNPRAHEGHDGDLVIPDGFAIISIHVPTRGTTHACRLAGHTTYFNPRAHEGHDLA